MKMCFLPNTKNLTQYTKFTTFTHKLKFMRVAIIDMGTNTFNLLVVEANCENHCQTLHNSKCFVKLGEGGIDSKYITPEAWERGLTAINSHMLTVESFNVDKVFAFATSAVRDAENGSSFVEEIFRKHQLKVKIIQGEEEALLIYQGVRQAVDLGETINLILDIGGGSNEFVLCNAKKVFWMYSFNLGVQRLLHQFNPSDPITPEEEHKIERFLEVELQPLINASTKHSPIRLIGSSGTFDTYRNLLAHSGAIPFTKQIFAEIPYDGYLQLHQLLLKSTKSERLAMQGMEPIRIDYIVLASIFTNFIVNSLGIKSIFQSNYALKEGALWEILNKS
jgi:exopolyphosphatase / guanosine-5'-triphosphate,3'-diphosphate pyrophosphatase